MSATHYLITENGIESGHIVSYQDDKISLRTEDGRIVEGRVEDFHTNHSDAKRARYNMNVRKHHTKARLN